jgi:GntR family transcriptional regulator, transcriptional repressor for pyruvate dehydrogenase complex
VIQQHQAILDAVKDRSPKAAAEAMRYHLRQTESDLRTVLQGVPKPEPKDSEE